MTDGGSNPTLSRWELAARLRQLRLDAGASVEDAAKELMCSPAKISRMETAGRGAQPRDIRDLTRFYGVPDATRDELMRAAEDAKKPGWWQDFRTLDEQVQTYIGLESAAIELRGFDPTRLIGPLQTSAYTSALIENLRPAGELTEEWISDTVALRQKRRERILDGDLQVHVVLDEGLLHRPIGGEKVMLELIDQLVEDAARPNVTLQVVTLGRGSYPGLDGSAQLLRFPPRTIDDVIYVEGILGNFLLDKGPEVARYLTVFDDICTRFALSPQDTTAWLKRFRKTYPTPTKKSPGRRPGSTSPS